ncbi:hypothetical protein V8G54_026434 [Vigna mungo]|uniref:Uncharacterized protein n=1 Tax=Vigna mungo TaxID=3915 RepID=A0AAQ3N0T0_VIGMU
MFRDARIAGQRPHWVGEHIWNSLWRIGIRHNTALNVLPPRKIGHQKKVVHCILEDPSPHMNMQFAMTLGRVVHVDEVFTQTHIRKGTSEYVDERSRKTIEDFFARLTQARPEGGSSHDGRVDADEEMIRTQCWVDTVGGKKKGRLYGVGQLASHYSAGREGIFRHQPSNSTTFDPNNVVSKDAYDSLLARFENLENLPPFQTTAVQDEDSDDSDDPDNPDDYHRPLLNPHTFRKRYRGLQPLDNSDGLIAFGITEGFKVVGNTEGHRIVGKVSDKQITDDFSAVKKLSSVLHSAFQSVVLLPILSVDYEFEVVESVVVEVFRGFEGVASFCPSQSLLQVSDGCEIEGCGGLRLAVVNGSLKYLAKDLGIIQDTVLQGTMVASSLMDNQGRKGLLIISFSGMGASILLHFVSFTWKVLAPYSGTLAVLGTVFSVSALLLPEIFASRIRVKAISLSLGTHWISNFVIGMYFLSVVDKFRISSVYLGFATVCLVTVLYIASNVVETKGRSLEEIELALSPST